MQSLDFVGLAGLIVGLAALVVAIYGIRDVREQVRLLIKLETNLAFSRVLHEMVWRFVEPTKEVSEAQAGLREMHQYTMLARITEPDKTLDAVQEAASNEVLSLAESYVSHGLATWRLDMDESAIREIVKSWQGEKNAELLKSMFGKQRGSLIDGKA